MIIGYWNIRGLGHPVRNLANYLGLKFEEKRYEKDEDWFEKDKMELGIPFPNLPYIIDGELQLSESKALMKYLCIKGKQESLMGKNEMDTVLIEQISNIISDQLQAIYQIITLNDDIKTYEKAFNGTVLPKFEQLEEFFGKNQFIGGDYLTWVDFNAAEFFEFLQAVSMATIKVNIYEKYKNVQKYVSRFMDLPAIKQFYSEEKNKLPFMPLEIMKFSL